MERQQTVTQTLLKNNSYKKQSVVWHSRCIVNRKTRCQSLELMKTCTHSSHVNKIQQSCKVPCCCLCPRLNTMLCVFFTGKYCNKSWWPHSTHLLDSWGPGCSHYQADMYSSVKGTAMRRLCSHGQSGISTQNFLSLHKTNAMRKYWANVIHGSHIWQSWHNCQCNYWLQ